MGLVASPFNILDKDLRLADWFLSPARAKRRVYFNCYFFCCVVWCFAGDPGRDPRGHTITVAFMAWAPSRAACNARAGDDAAEACFFSVERLPSMAFDHLKVRR